MSFWSDAFNVLTGQAGQPQTASDTIMKLSDRVQTSTLIEDRRAAVMGLKGLCREYREEVGNNGIPGLIKVLSNDRGDVDIIKATLETLNILCTIQNKEDFGDLGFKFTEDFLKEPETVTALLECLEEFDFYVRFNTIQLLNTLLSNESDRLQEFILAAPMGISRLVDLLDDRREIIRNEGLLLLTFLTQSNTDIQKIIAFENAFERLLEIISHEGGVDGGIVVQDCIHLIQNLLKYNVSNQTYFRETSCIQRIAPLLSPEKHGALAHYAPVENSWSEQKNANAVSLLGLTRTLVVPNNMNTSTNQGVIAQSGLLETIIGITLKSETPLSVKSHAFYALGDIIRGNSANQEKVANTTSVVAPTSVSTADGNSTAEAPMSPPLPPTPQSALLTMISYVIGKTKVDDLAVRHGATYVILCYLFDNIEGQIALGSTLVPPPDNNPNSETTEKPQSPGSLLLSSLLEWEEAKEDPYQVWFGSIILSHILKGNSQCKSTASKITFGDVDQGEEIIPLVNMIAYSLTMASREGHAIRVITGYLTLLSVWAYESPETVSQFLSEGANLQYLMEQISQSHGVDVSIQGLSAFLLGILYEFDDDPESSFPREVLQPIILKRVGVDLFVNHINRLRESKSLQNSSGFEIEMDANGQVVSDLLFDHSFVEFFKGNYELIQKSITVDPKAKSSKNKNSSPTISNDEAEFYKKTIGDQTEAIESLKLKIQELEATLEQQRIAYEEQIGTLNTNVETLGHALDEQNSKYKVLEQERDDLLVCLADQDNTIKAFQTHVDDDDLEPLPSLDDDDDEHEVSNEKSDAVEAENPDSSNDTASKLETNDQPDVAELV
ncbi:Vesicle-mediated ER to Golgi transport protein [Basidiobolus ranarum]|uniref:Vesicle-mediated ER to Golgi transport protein n=1 Tax=Basidiobolus ranarum TaxID=34480 RepID=A0ABR2X4A2_9FUNG